MLSIEKYYRHRYTDASRSETEPTFHQRIRAALKVIGKSPRRVLDFGCSVGAATGILAEAGHIVVGVDISASAIEQARIRMPMATFKLIDSEDRIPLESESFDVCFCSEVIEHLFDVQGFIGKVHRLLERGGLFVLSTPYHGWIKNLLIITFKFERHFSPTGDHIRFFSRKSLSHCLRTGGFEIERITGIGRFWPVWRSMFVVARKLA